MQQLRPHKQHTPVIETTTIAEIEQTNKGKAHPQQREKNTKTNVKKEKQASQQTRDLDSM